MFTLDKKIISKNAFVSRLTDISYSRLIQTSKTDIFVELWYEKFKLLDHVDLDDYFIKNGLTMMVQHNIISSEDIFRIIDVPILDHERPQ